VTFHFFRRILEVNEKGTFQGDAGTSREAPTIERLTSQTPTTKAMATKTKAGRWLHVGNFALLIGGKPVRSVLKFKHS